MKHKQEQATASEKPEELDSAGRPIYRTVQAPQPKPNDILIELATLELLADRLDAPHFVIRNFEKVDAYGLKTPKKGWNYHFIFLSHVGMVVAYETPEISEDGTEGGE